MNRTALILIALGLLAVVVFFALRAAGVVEDNDENGVPLPPEQRSENIVVTEPQEGSTISSPFTLSGEARVFEATVNYRLSQADGTVLVESFTMTDAADVGEWGPLEVLVGYPQPLQFSGYLEVYQISAVDGAEVDKLVINLILGDASEEAVTTTVNVYFGMADLDPMDCELTMPVARVIPATEAVGRAALAQLLTGPTAEEEAEGYFTSINPGVTVNSLTIQDGVARVDFDSRLEQNIGGSCLVTHVRAQITDTLTQFPTVDEVVISIEGRTEDILQP